VRKNDRGKISCEIKSIFAGSDRYFASMRAKEVMQRYESIYPKFTQSWRRNWRMPLSFFFSSSS